MTSTRTSRGLELRSFRFPPGRELASHAHARPALIVTTAGRFEGSLAGRRYACESGDLAIVPAAARHSERMGPRGARSIVVMPSTVPGHPGHEIPACTLTVIKGPAVRRAAWRLAVEWTSSDRDAPLAIEECLEDLFLAITGDEEPGGREPVAPALRRSREFLEATLDRNPSLDDVAATAGMSRARLTRSFRRAFGYSVAGYRRRSRLDRAALLLRDTETALSEVAAAVGFYDQSHLTNAFKRWVGCSPGAFRRAQRGHVRPAELGPLGD